MSETQQTSGESRTTAVTSSSPSRHLTAGSSTSTESLAMSSGSSKVRRPEDEMFLPRPATLTMMTNTTKAAKKEIAESFGSERSTLLGSSKSLQEISRVAHQHQHQKELLLRRGEELGSTKSLQEELKYDKKEFPLPGESDELRSRRRSEEEKSEEVLLRSSTTQEVLLRRGEELGSTRSLQEFQLVPVGENVKRAILIVKDETGKMEGEIVGDGKDLVTLKIPDEDVNDREEEALKRRRLTAEKEKELEALRAEEVARLKERKVKRDEEIERVELKILELERAREELLEKKGAREVVKRPEEDEEKVEEKEMREEEKRRTTEKYMVQAEMRTEETWKRIQLKEEERTLMKTQEKSLIKEGEGEKKESKKEEEERKERVLKLRQEIRRRRRERLEGEATLRGGGEGEIRNTAERNVEGLQKYTSTSKLYPESVNNDSLKEANEEEGGISVNSNSDQQLQKSTLGFDQKLTDDQQQLNQVAEVTSKLKQGDGKRAARSILISKEGEERLKMSHIYRQPPTRLTVVT